ncbi:MAG TPA: HD domain-containing protein [Patescibacteria group bacterium]|nr:HD domain-containing protein [Patescibacteria group bacterium]
MERGGTLQSRSFVDYILKESLLQAAYDFAQKAHKGQKRFEGTDYITHPLAVATIIYEEWGISDVEILVAALLHDTQEDCPVSWEELTEEFGDKVRAYVDSVTKFSSEKGPGSDSETINKLLDRSLFDPVSDVIKLADRLHNMRTMGFVPVEKQIPKALETKNIYSPLAESLGLWMVKTELEDLALKYLDPGSYNEFREVILNDPRLDPAFRKQIIGDLTALLTKYAISGTVSERVNSLSRLKAKTERENIRDIDDVISFRVVLDDLESSDETLSQVYRTFGLIRNMYKNEEDPTRMDDFYAIPRENKYSAIQLTVITPSGAIEIAVTSRDREDFNNWGIVNLIRRGVPDLARYALKLIITPRGPAKFLPPQATGVDFAYLLNPSFGLQESGIKVDGVVRDITENIPNGATVEILLGEERARPDPRLTRFAVLDRTKKTIEKQNKEADRREVEKEGEKLVDELMLKRGVGEFGKLPNARKLLYLIGCRTFDDLCYQIGAGSLKLSFLEDLINQNSA